MPKLKEQGPNVFEQEAAADLEAKIQIAKINWLADPYMHGENAANFHPSVHPKMIGWWQNSWAEIWPVYQTDNGLFAVKHEAFGGDVTNIRVEPNDVIPETTA